MCFYISHGPVFNTHVPRLIHNLLIKQKEQKLFFVFVRVPGIEPESRPWQGRVLPLNHTRIVYFPIIHNKYSDSKYYSDFGAPGGT